MINYHNRKFSPTANTENGETSAETVFHYQQTENIVTATYKGGAIKEGHLIALVDDKGCLAMRYHQVTTTGELQTGKCFSTPEILPNGKIRLHEKWQWTSGDCSAGESVIEEL